MQETKKNDFYASSFMIIFALIIRKAHQKGGQK
jgi:hypothetical protein